MYSDLNPILRPIKILKNLRWASSKIEGIDFKYFVQQRYGTTIGFAKNHVIKIQDYIHPDKSLDLLREAELIAHLNSLNCVSAPKLIHRGNLDGKPFLICERLHQRRGLKEVDVLFAFLELKGCGVIHGDLRHRYIGPSPHGDNIFYNGLHCVLLDYDQAIFDPGFASMSLSGLLNYLDEQYPSHNTKYMSTRKQLEAYHYQRHFINGRLDLSESSLVSKGETTIGYEGVYHDISESSVFLKGERGIDARLPVLEKIEFSGESILDVGCNTGLLSRYIARRGAKSVLGVEYSKEHSLVGQMINNCEGMNNVFITHHDVGKKKLSGSYDTALIFSVLHHVDSMEFAIKQIRNCCNRIIIECRLNEDGYKLEGKWKKTNRWNFHSLDDLISFLQDKFSFRFRQNYGAVDRERYLLEFVKT